MSWHYTGILFTGYPCDLCQLPTLPNDSILKQQQDNMAWALPHLHGSTMGSIGDSGLMFVGPSCQLS